jgi:hypothetical protein
VRGIRGLGKTGAGGLLVLVATVVCVSGTVGVSASAATAQLAPGAVRSPSVAQAGATPAASFGGFSVIDLGAVSSAPYGASVAADE